MPLIYIVRSGVDWSVSKYTEEGGVQRLVSGIPNEKAALFRAKAISAITGIPLCKTDQKAFSEKFAGTS